jgi:phosphatidylcholine synthase
MEPTFTLADRARAWSVHLYTAMGLPLAWACADALVDGNARRFFLFSAIACIIDASDGFFARRWRVKEVVPGFNGRRLDDIVDYIHFTALPLAALPALDLIPRAWGPMLILPLMASAYGFCQEMAKTEDSFVGFPSYWNIFALYFYILGAEPRTIVAILTVLSVLVFVPIHYIYPSKTKRAQLWTVLLGVVWTVMVIAISLRPDAAWARKLGFISLYYPIWYLIISLLHHRDVMRREAEGIAPVVG